MSSMLKRAETNILPIFLPIQSSPKYSPSGFHKGSKFSSVKTRFGFALNWNSKSAKNCAAAKQRSSKGMLIAGVVKFSSILVSASEGSGFLVIVAGI